MDVNVDGDADRRADVIGCMYKGNDDPMLGLSERDGGKEWARKRDREIGGGGLERRGQEEGNVGRRERKEKENEKEHRQENEEIEEIS